MSRAHLRSVRESDYPTLTRMRRDRDLQRTLLSRPGPGDPEDAIAWMARVQVDERRAFLVVAREDDESCIGFVQIADIDSESAHGRMGIALIPEVRGQGFGAEVLDLLHRHARDDLKLHKLVLEVLADNAPARHLYERCGYREVGVLRDHFAWDGETTDVVIMEKFL